MKTWNNHPQKLFIICPNFFPVLPTYLVIFPPKLRTQIRITWPAKQEEVHPQIFAETEKKTATPDQNENSWFSSLKSQYID